VNSVNSCGVGCRLWWLPTSSDNSGRTDHAKKPDKIEKPSQCAFVLYLAYDVRLRGNLNLVFFRDAQKRNKKSTRGNKLDARPRRIFFIASLSSPHREALTNATTKN
jgi:hypothetical protein